MDEYSTRHVQSHRRRRHFSQRYRPIDEDRYPQSDRRRPRRKHRWLAPLTVLALVIWFSPMLVSKTPLAGWAIRSALGDVQASLRCDSVSLGWLSPISLAGLQLDDADGQPLLKIAKASTSKRLFWWLVNRNDLGALRIEDPHLLVAFGPKETNWERALALWTKRDRGSHSLFDALRAAGITSFEVEVVDGSLALVDASAGRRCNLENLRASVRLISLSEGLRAKLTGNVEQDQRVSPVEATLELAPAAEGKLPATQNQLALKSEGMPLWPVAALARRSVPQLQLDGQLASNFQCAWRQQREGRTQATLKGDAVAKNLYCAAPWLNGDQLRLAEARLPLEVEWRGDELKVVQARLDCELGQVGFAGSIDTSTGWLQSLRSRAYQLNGHIDLARLAAMLPATIRLRSATRITAGVVDVVLNADQKHDGLAWQGRLDASNLVAMNRGQTITWEKPVHLTFDAHQTPAGLTVDRLYGEADFLELQGEGTPDQGHVSASFDLNKLSAQLSRFIDLSSLRLAGYGSAYATWQRSTDSRFLANAQIDAQDFELTRSGNRSWREPRIELVADMSGVTDGAKLERIDSAAMRVTAGSDVLSARLHQPITQFDEGGLWSVALALRGELGRWLPRVEPWIGSYPNYELAGNCDLTADIVYSSRALEVEPLAAKIQNLRLVGPSLNIAESLVDLSGTAVWNRSAQQFSLHDARWASAVLVAEARNVVVLLDKAHAGQLQGKLTYSGDIEQLWKWTSSQQSPSSWHVAGRLEGSVDMRRTADVIEANFDNSVDRLLATWAGGHAWQEPHLRVSARLEHDLRQKLLRLDRFNVDGLALACAASGEIRDLDSERNLRLDGTLRYDLARLAPLWQQFTGAGVRLEGADQRSFSIRGPLVRAIARRQGYKDELVAVHRGQPGIAEHGVDALAGNAELHWTGGDLYGFALGSGDLRGQLARGVITFDPITTLASQGRLYLAPTIRLSPGPAELSVAPGRAAQQIQITPEMCERALKYIAPVLAGVTEAQGRFSIDLEGCRVPLANPRASDVAGKMTIHNVAVGPGPLIQELAVLMNRAAPAQLTRESIVEFRMVDGRIYHRGLELAFPEFVLRTYGSVGLDESLAIMAEMPVPPKWIGDNPLGESLRGQIIQLPIGGTLHAPKIDQKVLAQTSARFLGRAATGIIKQELMNGLEHIFGPPR